MANTYTSLHYHFIFSTKNREPWISPEVEQCIWEYLGGIARQNDMKARKLPALRVGLMAQASLRDALTPACPIRASKRPATIGHRYAVKIPNGIFNSVRIGNRVFLAPTVLA